MNFLIEGADILTVVRSTVSRVLRLGWFFLSGRGPRRYIALTPSCFRTQILYDRRSGRLTKTFIRDAIDYETLAQVFLREDYDLSRLIRGPELNEMYDSVVASGRVPLILDIGGNVGLASLYFLHEFPLAQIVLVEPDLDNLGQAQLNVTSGACSLVHAAIGSESGSGEVVDPGLGNNSLRFSARENGSIRMVTVPELLERYPPSLFYPFVAKIDIEGFESVLFEKQTEWVSDFPLLIVELHDWLVPRQCVSGNFLKAIAPLNRDFVYLGENIFSIRN